MNSPKLSPETLPFIYERGQGSDKTLQTTRKGNCLAYAKYRISDNPGLALFVTRDNVSKIHFGVAEKKAGTDNQNGRLMYSDLTKRVRTHDLLASSELVESVLTGHAVTHATQDEIGGFDLAEGDRTIFAVGFFVNSGDWSSLFAKIAQDYNPERPFASVRNSVGQSQADTLV
jgi:hypothetical protein